MSIWETHLFQQSRCDVSDNIFSKILLAIRNIIEELNDIQL